MTVYLPDELHEYVRSHRTNVSALLQRAIRREAQLEGMARLADELTDEGLVDEELVQRWMKVLGVEADPFAAGEKLGRSLIKGGAATTRTAKTVRTTTAKAAKTSRRTKNDSKSGRQLRTDA